MIEPQLVIDTIKDKFENITNLGNGILRGERRYAEKTYAVSFFDVNDEIVRRSQNLAVFQENLLGDDFFSTEKDIRWNSYLYFLTGSGSINDSGFVKAKSLIEADRHFARKFVLSLDDLKSKLGHKDKSEQTSQIIKKDPGTIWSEILEEGQLGLLFEQKARTKVIEQIGFGTAFQVSSKPINRGVTPKEDPLRRGVLRSLSIGQFRLINSGKTFKFGDVNLIFGTNGTGKTSLLEAIETLYCGRVQRDAKATFSNMVAEVELPSGELIKIEATTNAAELKARNLTWYGRPDPQSSAISHGFSTFNFLDTDAAFRLSSEVDPIEIKLDINKLIVGPEISQFWTYLFKIDEDIQKEIKAINGRLPTLNSQVDLLDAEVVRLRLLPSESKSLATSFRSTLIEMGVKWEIDNIDPGKINPGNRLQLESLSKLLGTVIAALNSTPVTIPILRERAKSLKTGFEETNTFLNEHSEIGKDVIRIGNGIRETTDAIKTLQKWQQYCEANVFEIEKEIRTVQIQISLLSKSLENIVPSVLPELSLEYLQIRIEDALQIADKNLETHLQDEATAVKEVMQKQKVELTLSAIRRDLHDSALSVLEKTGDNSFCPVCGNLHEPSVLLQKIESLLIDDATSGAIGLNKILMASSERVAVAKSQVEILSNIYSFSQSKNSIRNGTCSEIIASIIADKIAFDKLVTEKNRLESKIKYLEENFGFSLESLATLRQKVSSLFVVGSEIERLESVTEFISKQRESLSALNSLLDSKKKRATQIESSVANILISLKLVSTSNLDISLSITLIERSLIAVNDAISNVGRISSLIRLIENGSFEDLKRAIDQAISSYDKMIHALEDETRGQDDLKNKVLSLDSARRFHSTEISKLENLSRATKVISKIVNEQSLDKMTIEVLKSIKNEITDIFSRIHSPQEYELGDFEKEKFLIKRDNKIPHGVDQISAGQRAAFALSIFLALNSSAESAPPVILIDDPIAHIDDLNSLSFIDFLRDLVLQKKKQIFFATADARLAALFQRKFEFLGKDRFKTIPLSR